MLPLPGTPAGRSGFYLDADTRVYLFDVDDKVRAAARTRPAELRPHCVCRCSQGVWTERPGAILLGADD